MVINLTAGVSLLIPSFTPFGILMVLNFIFGLYRVIFGFIPFGILIVFFLFMIFI